MKLAILSDIHGNLPALEAVVADVARRGADVTVNLGDIVSGPLQPLETARRLMPLDIVAIRGNHERQLLTLRPQEMSASDRFAHAALDDAARAWLASLPQTLLLGDDVLLAHGTPDSDSAYFLETVEPAGCRPATPEEAAARAGAARASLILCGHTHTPRLTRLPDGRLALNPGSVGLPALRGSSPWPHVTGAGSPHARYATAERRAGGWDVSFHAVAYDWDRAAAIALRNGRPDWAHTLRAGWPQP